MKVVLCIHSLGCGGAERVTATLANAWAARGDAVTIATLEPLGNDYYQLDPGIRRVSLEAATPSRGTLSAVMANLGRVRSLRRLLQREAPDAAIAMMTTMNVILAIAGLGKHSVVRLGSERFHPPQQPLSAAWNRARAWAYGGLDGVVVQTEETRRWMLAHTRARSAPVIPNACVWPLPAQAPVRAPESVGTAGRKRLLAAGRLVRQKGFDRLIEAFAGIDAPDWELVIAGEGPLRADLQQQIDRAGQERRIHLAGEVGNMADWYQSADLFVLASRFEGFPNVLVEAMSYGVPVISVDCDTGPRDIIRPEVDGILVPDGDSAALRGALGRLCSDEALRTRLGDQAEAVRDRFSIPWVAAEWDRVIAQVRGR